VRSGIRSDYWTNAFPKNDQSKKHPRRTDDQPPRVMSCMTEFAARDFVVYAGFVGGEFDRFYQNASEFAVTFYSFFDQFDEG